MTPDTKPDADFDGFPDDLPDDVPDESGERRVVLLTGAARRIGACTSSLFHARGYNVIIHCRGSGEEARSLRNTLNASRHDSARVLEADLNDNSQTLALADSARAQYGRIDVLVNNASAFYATPFPETSEARWEDLMGSNLKGAWFLSQALAKTLVQHEGSIVNIVDVHADQALKGFPIYSIAKAGLKAMTHALARELAPTVRVNGVSPGAILWPENAGENSPGEDAAQQAILERTALGRQGTPEDIAEAVFFLATRATYITGQVIRVAGGRR